MQNLQTLLRGKLCMLVIKLMRAFGLATAILCMGVCIEVSGQPGRVCETLKFNVGYNYIIDM